MPDSTPAVFLSYASQDADAARRIAEALRAAGIEVWFDQNELVGGDAWDQKIRRQIQSCTLFVPVISSHTEARPEGYFRLEWKLAVDRSHLMSDDHPFLFPVVIDDTPDATARVPDRFRERQWMRLNDRDTPESLAKRVQAMLNTERVPATPQPTKPDDAPRTESPPPPRQWFQRKSTKLIGMALGLTAFAFLVLRPIWWSQLQSLESNASETTATITAPLSEADELVAKAWDAMQRTPEPYRSGLELADDYAERATELEPGNAAAWAVWSQVDTWTVALNYDRSPARREEARTKAARAMSLAPESYEARLAEACYLVRGEGFHTVSTFATDLESRLRTLLQERPDEPRALLALGHFLRSSRRYEESAQTFDRLARNPDQIWVAAATNAKAFALRRVDGTAARVAAEQSVEAQPFYANIYFLAAEALSWQGDLDAGKAWIDRMPPADLMEDFGLQAALRVFHWRREPDQMLRLLNAVPRDWLQSNLYTGPKAYWTGVAHAMAGNAEAATLAWQSALRLVDERLAGQPDNAGLLVWRGGLLTELGDPDAAARALTLARQLGLETDEAALPRNVGLLLEPDPESRVERLRRFFPWALLNYSPDLDDLRGLPAFQQLLAEAERDPDRNPHANTAPSRQSPDGTTEDL